MTKEIIVYVSLLSFLLIGVFFKEKIKSFKDYALGSKPYTKITMSATVVATLMGGGSTIGEVGMAYNSGMIYIVTLLFMPIGYVITSIFVVPRLKDYYGCYSLPEVIDKMYGNLPRKFTALMAYVMCIGALSMQIKGLSVIFSNIFGYDLIINSIIAFVIIIIYTTIGGIDSVIKTDIVQFLIFIIILPIIILGLLKDNGGSIQAVLEAVPEASYIKDITLMSFTGLLIYSLLPDGSADFIHRMLIGRDTQKNRMAVNAMALVSGLSILMVLIISGIALAKHPNIIGDNAVFLVMREYMSGDIGYALFGVALIAIILSTADSLVNTSSIIFVNDILSKEIKDKKKVFLCRLMSLVTGFMAIVIAIKSKSILDIILFFGQFYSSAIFAPFFLGLFFKQKREVMYWSSSLIGIVSYLVLKIIFPKLENGVFLISLAMSIIAYIGFSKVEINKKLFKAKVDEIIGKANRMVINNNIPISKLGYGSLPISIFVLASNFSNNAFTPSFYIDISIVLMGILLAYIDVAFDKESKLKSIVLITLFWYCFPFFSMYLYFCQNTATMFAFNFVVTMLLLAGLYSWEKIIFNIMLGYIVAALVFFTVHGPELKLFIEKMLVLLLVLSYISLLSFVILRRKMSGMKEFFDNRILSLNIYNIKKEKKLVEQYQLLIPLIEKNFNVKNKLDRMISEEKNMQKDFVLTVKKLKPDMQDYFALQCYKAGIEYKIKIESQQQELLINVSAVYIYTIIINITEILIGLLNEKGKLNTYIKASEKVISIEFKLDNFFMELGKALQYQDKQQHELKKIEKIFKMNQWSFEIEGKSLTMLIMLEEPAEMIVH